MNYCVDCKFYHRYVGMWGSGVQETCRFRKEGGLYNLITGRPIVGGWPTCEEERYTIKPKDDKICGPEGKNFSARSH